MEITTKNYQEDAARMFCEAIKELANNPAALENMQLYLSHHFADWLKLYASKPYDIAGEMEAFAGII